MGICLFNSRGGGLHHMNNKCKKGFFIDKPWLRRLLRIEKGEKFISYLSFVFVLLGYVYALAIIPCVVIMLFLEIATAKWIAVGHFGVVMATLIVIIIISYVLDRKKPEKWT